MKRTLWILLAVGLSGTAHGAGFSIYEQGARALGTGGAYTARVADPTAIFFNPAALTRIEHGELVLGSSLIVITREFAGVNQFPGNDTKETSPTQAFFPTHLFWGQSFSPKFGAGFGIYVPFGLTTEWENPDQFSGRFISTRASILPIYFNPAVAVEPVPGLRLGGGVMGVYSTLELNRHVGEPNPLNNPVVLDLGTVELKASNGLDFGYNLGVQIDAGDRVQIGVNYRSSVNLGFKDGDADFTFTGSGTALDPVLVDLFPQDQKVSTEVKLPALLVGAVAVKPGARWVLEVDLGWTRWSEFKAIVLEFEDPSLNTSLVQNWEDALFIRTGMEYDLDPRTRLRLGYYYDETPQPTAAVSPILPDQNRHGLSAGVGRDWGKWSGDLFGLLLLAADRETGETNREGYAGSYANSAWILGLSVSYRY